jgi:hypothetical protein
MSQKLACCQSKLNCAAAPQLTSSSSKLIELIGQSDYELLVQAVHDTALEFPDIIGVLAVGTFVQTDIPDGFFIPKYNTPRGRAYDSIRNPGRRRLSAGEESDLDLWICVRDTETSTLAQERVELCAIAMLSELVSGTISWGSVHWHNKKAAIFGPYYKKKELYPPDFVTANINEPWLAHGFKMSLEARLVERIPEAIDTINKTFRKKIPGEFLEIRAFSESLFHLRPDDTIMPNTQEDRMPFPRVADDQWISPAHSSVVMYASDSVSIYPFKPNGRILGCRISEYLRTDDFVVNSNSYGGLVIKPDALRKQQSDLILMKIEGALAGFDGRIVAQKRLMAMSEADVEAMYPLLRERELLDVKDYLVGGDITILIIQATIPASELFHRINALKGPRLIDRSYERLMEGRILDGSIRDLLPVPGEENAYKAILPTIFSKKSNPAVRFTDEEYRFYAQNLVHSPDNEVELEGLFKLANFSSQS